MWILGEKLLFLSSDQSGLYLPRSGVESGNPARFWVVKSPLRIEVMVQELINPSGRVCNQVSNDLVVLLQRRTRWQVAVNVHPLKKVSESSRKHIAFSVHPAFMLNVSIAPIP